MKEIDKSIPAKRIRRGYYLLALLGIVLIAASSWLMLQRAQQVLRERSRRELQTRAESCAQVIADWRQTLQAEMIALAEQRGMRQGLSSISGGTASGEWRAGFTQAADAACRALPAAASGVRNFALRGLDGRRIAGTGKELEQVYYPDIMQRILTQPITSGNRNNYAEKWIVPVRDAEAKPLAFLVAEVNPAGSKKMLLRFNLIADDDLFCLEDSSGIRLWDSNESLKIPELDVCEDQFQAGDEIYDLARADVPGTGWIFALAAPGDGADPNLKALSRSGIFCVIVAAIVLSLISLLLSGSIRAILGANCII